MIEELEEYFPSINKVVKEKNYSFRIRLYEEESSFTINLLAKQRDNKKERTIKLRIGLARHKNIIESGHPEEPHFEIDIYKRDDNSFSATVYFTLQAEKEELIRYAKGTIVIIAETLKNIIIKNNLSEETMKEIVNEKRVIKELSEYKPSLIKKLKESFKTGNLILRTKEGTKTITTLHNLKKYLDIEELQPIYLPLKEEARK